MAVICFALCLLHQWNLHVQANRLRAQAKSTLQYNIPYTLQDYYQPKTLIGEPLKFPYLSIHLITWKKSIQQYQEGKDLKRQALQLGFIHTKYLHRPESPHPRPYQSLREWRSRVEQAHHQLSYLHMLQQRAENAGVFLPPIKPPFTEQIFLSLQRIVSIAESIPELIQFAKQQGISLTALQQSFNDCQQKRVDCQLTWSQDVIYVPDQQQAIDWQQQGIHIPYMEDLLFSLEQQEEELRLYWYLYTLQENTVSQLTVQHFSMQQLQVAQQKRMEKDGWK